MHQPGQMQPRLGLFDVTTLVVGSMIGSGIFVAPSIMAQYVSAPGLILGLWVFGGLFTILGALSMAELAAMMPRAGGTYVFISETFGRFWGFLYGWTLFLIIQTGFNAAVAIAFAKYLGTFLPALAEGHVLVSLPLGDRLGPETAKWLPSFLQCFEINTAQLTACGVIALLTGINILGVREGARVQNLFTVLKLAALGALIAAGLPRLRVGWENLLPLFDWRPGVPAANVGFLAGAALALSKALFAYDAWNTSTFVAEEIRNPQQTLPRALILGTAIVMLVYVLTNVRISCGHAHRRDGRGQGESRCRAGRGGPVRPRWLDRSDRGDPYLHFRLCQRHDPGRRSRGVRDGSGRVVRSFLRPAAPAIWHSRRRSGVSGGLVLRADTHRLVHRPSFLYDVRLGALRSTGRDGRVSASSKTAGPAPAASLLGIPRNARALSAGGPSFPRLPVLGQSHGHDVWHRLNHDRYPGLPASEAVSDFCPCAGTGAG